MFKRMATILQPGVWGLLLAGCAAKTGPAPEDAGAAPPPGARQVTIHVPAMIQRQGIT